MKKYIFIIGSAFVNLISVIEFYSKFKDIVTALLYTAPLCLICLAIAFFSLFFDFRKQTKELNQLKEEYNELSKMHKAITSQYSNKKSENEGVRNILQSILSKWHFMGLSIANAAKDKKHNRTKDIQDIYNSLSNDIENELNGKEEK